MRRLAVVVLWLPAVLLLVAVCGGNSGGRRSTPQLGGSPASSDPGRFKIGLLVPLTGSYAGIGKDVLQGFQLYLEQHAGSLGGYRVEMVAEDDASTPQTGLTKLRKLTEQDRVNALVGLVSGAVAYGVRDYIDEHGLITLDAVAGADGLTQTDASASIFRVAPTNSQEAYPLADYVCTRLAYRRVTLVALDYTDGWESAGGFARAFRDLCGGTIAQEIYAPLNTADWGPFVQKIDQIGAGAVIASLAGDDAQRFLKTYRDFGVRLPLLGTAGLTDELVLGAEGATAAGVLTTGHCSAALDDPATQAFVLAYAARNGGATPGWYAASGYLSAQLLDLALQRAGSAAAVPETLRQALRSLRIEHTVCGSAFRFDDQQQGVFDVYVREVAKLARGRYGNEVQKPATYHDVSQFWTYAPDAYLRFKPYADLKGTWERP